MKILIVDDHQLFRSGLCYLLAGIDGDIHFLEAESCEQAVALSNKGAIDLVLLDFHLPGKEGFDALAAVKDHYSCSIVVLSGEQEPDIIRRAIAVGAGGFIPKSSSPEVLVAALQLVLSHGIYLPPNVLDNYRCASVNGTESDSSLQRESVLKQLSRRQLEVLIKAAQGKPNKVIARELYIAEGTVKAHLSACYRVLDVDNRTEAVFATASLGLLPEGKCINLGSPCSH